MLRPTSKAESISGGSRFSSAMYIGGGVFCDLEIMASVDQSGEMREVE
jgi:hypothetical protein